MTGLLAITEPAGKADHAPSPQAQSITQPAQPEACLAEPEVSEVASESLPAAASTSLSELSPNSAETAAAAMSLLPPSPLGLPATSIQNPQAGPGCHRQGTASVNTRRSPTYIRYMPMCKSKPWRFQGSSAATTREYKRIKGLKIIYCATLEEAIAVKQSFGM